MGESGGSFSGTTAPSMRSSGGDPVVMCMSLAPPTTEARSNWCRLTLRPSSGFIFVRSRSGQGFSVEERFGVGAPKLRGGAPLNSLQRGGGGAPEDRGAEQLVQIDVEAFVRVHFRSLSFGARLFGRRTFWGWGPKTQGWGPAEFTSAGWGRSTRGPRRGATGAD